MGEIVNVTIKRARPVKALIILRVYWDFKGIIIDLFMFAHSIKKGKQGLILYIYNICMWIVLFISWWPACDVNVTK